MSNTKADEVINHHKTFNTGPLRLMSILYGINFEIKFPGGRLTAKAPKCSTILRKEFGLKGKPESLRDQFQALLATHGIA